MTSPAPGADRLVIRIEDDAETPTVGRVVGWEDDERVLVLWGDDAYSADTGRARIEAADELTTWRRRSRS